MQLSDFVFINDPKRKGGALILLTLQPFALVEVWTFKSSGLLAAFNEEHRATGVMLVPEYNIGLKFAGTLDRRLVQVSLRTEIMQAATRFFIDGRLKVKPGIYKRYKCTDEIF